MKQNILRTFLAAVLLSVASVQHSVASSGIAVTLLGYTIDSTLNVNLGYTLTISAIVKNTDGVNSFSGPLDFGLHTNTHTLTTFSLFSKPFYSGSTQIFLDTNESVPALFSVDIDPQFFSPGPDVVVVWPICTSPITDSVRIPLNIVSPNAITDEQEQKFNYFVTEDKIFLQNIYQQINFKQVRIISLLGQTVSSLTSNFITEIPIPDLPKGIYLCELVTNDNSHSVIKFFH